MAFSTHPGDLGSLNLAFVEELYARFVRDPESVPEDWRRFFEEERAETGEPESDRLAPSWQPAGFFEERESAAPAKAPTPSGDGARRAGGNGPVRLEPPRTTFVARPEPRGARELDVAALQDRVDQLIRSYRVRGHMLARIDPLEMPRQPQPELEPAFYGLSEADMDRTFSATTIRGFERVTLREILDRMRNTYCRSIGVQFMHIDDLAPKRWLQDRMEGTENRLVMGRNQQLRILRRLTDAVVFEEFIQTKYLGAKSFSLEGAESLIPLLELAIDKAGDQGVDEIVLAMAHRGRLNVLANVMGKRARDIFWEFEDKAADGHVGRGDVKYHLGYSHDWRSLTGHKVHLSLSFNPSHLEFVNPVAVGRMRAKQDRAEDYDRQTGMVLMIHGDAAFAGEGIVQETLNLSQLPGYSIGGTIHVVLNNQIGFTTPPSQARSSVYATDVAKMLQSPIFHVNGEDPEAVAQCVELAMGFRREFKRDVVIDMYCYRRRGHNEGDEPAFTQPLLYRAIADRRPVRDAYVEHLLELGGVTREQADALVERRRQHFETELEAARSGKHEIVPVPSMGGIWSGYVGGPDSNAREVETGVPREHLSEFLETLSTIPPDFHPHPKITRGMDLRRKMAAGERPLDWSAAETLAYATLACEGHRIRLSGQDAERGTFSHRHAVLHDYNDGHTYVPLQNLADRQAPVEIINSPLSENGVLGFEYGYSLDCPDGLVAWEAQFGDFGNAAQVIIDQFIASAEDKWRRLSGLVLLLPHGFEGMGPEHSSARLERFLMIASEDNIQVASPTTPAQFFHLMRRQIHRKWRKPLVVMTPKSLLRHPVAVSGLDELAAGAFRRILPDARPPEAAGTTKRVLLCTGKIYYDLLAERESRKRDDVAILRLEQIYPLDHETLRDALKPYAEGTPVVWVQEEPLNMGAWYHLRVRFLDRLLDGRFPFHGITRPPSASPATGSAASHRIEQEKLLEAAFS